MFPTSMSQNVEIAPPTAYISQSYGTPSFSNPEVFSPSPESDMVPEPAEDDNNDDISFWEANEIKDGHEM
ncbi:hypothetical protein BDR06DRAFT_956921 [Suillus hirtellus]|nr:hypothetical protein BDR06DRAFT_956921 [Suillus hirtellus]